MYHVSASGILVSYDPVCIMTVPNVAYCVLQREAVVSELRARREAPQPVRRSPSPSPSPSPRSSDVAEVSITSVVQNKDYTAYIMRCTARSGPEVWQVRGSRPGRARKPSLW
jgi:hypothetical protein